MIPLLSESIYNGKIFIRMLNPLSMDRVKTIQYNRSYFTFLFSIIEEMPNIWYLQISIIYDLSYASDSRRTMNFLPQEQSVRMCADAWKEVMDFIQKRENWNVYFPTTPNRSSISDKIKIRRVVVHHNKAFADNGKENNLYRYLLNYLGASSINTSGSSSKLSRDVEGVFINPIELKRM